MSRRQSRSRKRCQPMRARETEQKMTDDERFSLLISVMGTNSINPVRDQRIPEGVPMGAGYTPGVPRLEHFSGQCRT
jgi:hypothetical protein